MIDDNEALRRAMAQVADAITPQGAVGGSDATGGHVRSLTEAVMGMTAGLVQIAEAIDNLAEAVRDRA